MNFEGKLERLGYLVLGFFAGICILTLVYIAVAVVL